eukprot:Blabericola_migrator_1__4998@NODE_2598_length_2554_cov_165_538802_g1629_i0_p1_GENE_NODE_2598_length_2554_cov_165_538802_g1629_i0NODE_2598_length_2554_cov_165_538802_g1629_i0_p1_ORF_typecomplete_len291_score50_47Ca_bind_SSO6904/PF18249_1/8e02Ca_bind_SSO6904/PF18249_1/3_9Ca_bind_SSO6904/PF18249_1/9_2e02_NODE_2598_length_2554_cov_165_538802_g1629_i01841056
MKMLQQRLHHTRMQEEHNMLGEMMSILRELEAERKSLQNMCPSRVYPQLESFTPEQDALYRQLRALGDHKRNAAAINSLLVPNNPEQIMRFIEELVSIRNAQRNVLDEFEKTHQYDERIDEILCVHVLEVIEEEIDRVEETCPPELPPDCTPEQQIATFVDIAAQRLIDKGFLEDLKHERRGLLVEMTILRLSMLHQLVRLDIDYRSLLAKYRLSKFHVRGYDPNEVENVKDSEWYRGLGTSTSLRNSMKIRNSANSIFARAVDILANNKERPIMPPELAPSAPVDSAKE